jgi:hydroxymethylglutaryl-CoA synthase
MVGITGYGGYIPFYRLKRERIASSWRRRPLKGERSVANNDEDCISMAVEAGRTCLHNKDANKVEGVYFASTSSPYIEKMCSTIIASGLDCRLGIPTADFTNSLRAGTTALRSALDSVKAGSAESILVTAADCRLGYPRSDDEQLFGDGGASILVGSENVLASLEETSSVYHEMMDVWRNREDKYVRSWEGRWVLGEGYQNTMKAALSAFFKEKKIQPKEISKAVLYAPDPGSQQRLVKSVGLDPKQVQSPLIDEVGNFGVAQVPIVLISALEEANPGDLILVASYGDGVDILLFRVTEEIKNFQPKLTVKKYLDTKAELDSYEKYLSFRGLLEAVPGEPYRLLPSATSYWRDRNSILRFHGSKCNKCGKEIFPIHRVCYNCLAKDDFTELSFANRIGDVFSFTLDNLAGRSDDPVIIQIVAEFGQEEARIYAMMADCDPSIVKVGMKVEMTFRYIWDGCNFHNYYWKFRPVRQ